VLAALGAAAAYHVFTPLCPPQAPLLLAAVLYVPSLQSPVVPAGAPAGTCDVKGWAIMTAAINARYRNNIFTFFSQPSL
jgi:hypothetical protein